jgi:hypothetical protein
MVALARCAALRDQRAQLTVAVAAVTPEPLGVIVQLTVTLVVLHTPVPATVKMLSEVEATSLR